MKLLIALCVLFCTISVCSGSKKDSELIKAARNGDFRNVTKLLKEDNTRVNETDFFERTPLHLAAQYGYDKIAKLLIDNGASVSAVDKRNMLPLHLAVNYDHTKIVNMLLKKNDSVINVVDIEKNTLLHYAALQDNFKIFEMLLNIKSANIDPVNIYGSTPLAFAAILGDEKKVELLLDKKANIKIKDKYNNTILHNAVYMYTTQNDERTKIFKLLLGKLNGADRVINERNYRGRTPLMELFQEHDDSKTAELLIDHDANINDEDIFGNTGLHLAASAGNMEQVKLLLKNGISKDTRNSVGKTPLHCAITHGKSNITMLLIDAGANVNILDDTNSLALHYALEKKLDDVAILLINKTDDINARNVFNMTALHFAANGSPNINMKLLNNNANLCASNDEGLSPIHIAAQSGNKEVLELFMNEAKFEINSTNSDVADNKTLLQLAIENGNMDTAVWLIKHNADINTRDNQGWMLIHSAARFGNIEMMKWLIVNNQSVNAENMYGNTPLHFGVRGGHVKIVNYLLEKEANINKRNHDWQNSAHFAVQEGKTDILEILLKSDINVNEADVFGTTPLGQAVLYNNEPLVNMLVNKTNFDLVNKNTNETILHEAAKRASGVIVKNLINHGANISLVDKNKQTPLHRAAAYDNWQFVKCVLDENVINEYNINNKDINSQSALHLAATKGHRNVAEIMIDKGADLELKDSTNNTPLDLAVAKGHHDVAKCLIEQGAIISESTISLLYKDDALNQAEISEMLLKNAFKHKIKLDDNMKNLLEWAVRKGYKSAVEILAKKMEKKWKKIWKEKDYTPLHLAASFGNEEIVKTLLDHKIEIDAESDKSIFKTPINLAADKCHDKVVEILLDNKADTSIESVNKTNTYDIAYDRNKTEQSQNCNATFTLIQKYENEKKMQFVIVISVILLCVFVCICLCLQYCLKKNSFRKKPIHDVNAEMEILIEKFMFPQSKVMLCEQLGKGQFGTVFKAYAHQILPNENETKVAVKVIKKISADQKKMFLSLGSELKIMMQLGAHVNLVNLLGIVTENIFSGELRVIEEYCRYGNLKDFLIQNRKAFNNSKTIDATTQQTKGKMPFGSGHTTTRSLAWSDLISWSYQIARGMQFLASKNIVYGDLAARNILLADNNVVKINNFGLARSMHNIDTFVSEKKSIPAYKWFAIESMQSGTFSTQSDVWAFGIVLWEIFSLGASPYPGIEIIHLTNAIMNGHIMEKPPYANENIYNVMRSCWQLNPEKRPTFDFLKNCFAQFL